MVKGTWISLKTYELLRDMCALAQKKAPVQGKWDFRHWNCAESVSDFAEKSGVAFCGTTGCLAGGYLPKINPKRFYFSKNGHLHDGEVFFDDGDLSKELGKRLFKAFFISDFQSAFGLPDLEMSATKKKVLTNAEALLKIVAELVDIGVAVANVEQRVKDMGIQEQDIQQLYSLREQYRKASRGVLDMPNLSWFSFEPHN